MSAAAVALLAGLGGCQSSLFVPEDTELRTAILETARRDLNDARTRPGGKPLVREERVEALKIDPEILKSIEATTGPGSYAGMETKISADLLGREQTFAKVNLQRVILTSVQNNLAVQFARLGPAIDSTRVAQAEAAFDFTVIGSAQYTRTHEQRVITTVAIPNETHNRSVSVSGGLRRRFESGGTLTVQQAFTRNKDQLPVNFNYTPNPNPANNSELTLQLDHPLLRNFGSDANLAQIRIEQNATREQVQQLKQQLLRTITEAEEAYWGLVASHANLLVARRLLERGEEVQGLLLRRMNSNLPVKQSQYSDAVAQVESRRADLIRAEAGLRAASDRLKLLMNDPGAPVGGETLLLPADSPVDEPIRFNVLDCYTSALNNRPEMHRALIGIDNASIRMGVADNQRLPELNLRAQIKLTGQRDNVRSAVTTMTDGQFVDHVVSLTFEQPIGNRAAEAAFVRARLERMQTVIAYKDVAQRIVKEVRESLVNVESAYKLIAQLRAARIAAAENVRSLRVEEENLVELTPEFMDLKLRRQLALAQAEFQEIQALAEYNAAVGRLYGAMGTSLERNRIEFRPPTTDELWIGSPRR